MECDEEWAGRGGWNSAGRISSPPEPSGQQDLTLILTKIHKGFQEWHTLLEQSLPFNTELVCSTIGLIGHLHTYIPEALTTQYRNHISVKSKNHILSKHLPISRVYRELSCAVPRCMYPDSGASKCRENWERERVGLRGQCRGPQGHRSLFGQLIYPHAWKPITSLFSFSPNFVFQLNIGAPCLEITVQFCPLLSGSWEEFTV